MKTLILFIGAFMMTVGFVWAEQPQIIVAKFDAEWCTNCRAMDPAYHEFKDAFESDDVVFVKFDRTNEQANSASAEKASELGIRSIFDAYPNTGFALIIDGHSKKVLQRLTKADSYSDMVKKLSQAGDAQLAEETGVKGSMMKGNGSKGSGY